jgi:hypothetical protein
MFVTVVRSTPDPSHHLKNGCAHDDSHWSEVELHYYLGSFLVSTYTVPLHFALGFIALRNNQSDVVMLLVGAELLDLIEDGLQQCLCGPLAISPQ